MEFEQLQNFLSGVNGRGGSSAGENVLVEFKAGQVQRDGTTMTADVRKGQLVLLQQDGLLHLQWRLRPSGTTSLDIVCVPGEASLERLTECTDGRVYLLEFKNDKSRRKFYWMQDLKDDKDEEFIKQANDYLSGRTPLTGGSGGGSEASGLGRLDQNQLLQMLTGAMEQPPSRVTQQSRGGAAAAAAPANAPASAADVPLSLDGVLDPDLVLPLLQDAETMAALLPHLPAQQRTREALREQLRSPQLRQTLARLTEALNSGQAAPLLAQLGLPATSDIGVDALLRALQERANAQPRDEAGSTDQ